MTVEQRMVELRRTLVALALLTITVLWFIR